MVTLKAELLMWSSLDGAKARAIAGHAAAATEAIAAHGSVQKPLRDQFTRGKIRAT